MRDSKQSNSKPGGSICIYGYYQVKNGNTLYDGPKHVLIGIFP